MAAKWRQRKKYIGEPLTTSDYIALAALGSSIVFGVPTLLLIIAQTRDMTRKKREGIGERLKGKNWNNLGLPTAGSYPYPAIEIYISSVDVIGCIEGNITNCSNPDADLEICTFNFVGKLNSKGIAEITLRTSVGSHELNVGMAKIKYREEDNTLDFIYLHDHGDNPHIARDLSLPRFQSCNLCGC